MHLTPAMEAATFISVAIALISGAMFVITIAGRTPARIVLNDPTPPMKTVNTIAAAIYALLSLAGVVVFAQMMACSSLACCP